MSENAISLRACLRAVIIQMAAILMTSALGGFCIVWLRHQISQTAGEIQAVERVLIKLERKKQNIDYKIARIHQPAYLQRCAQHFGLSASPREIIYLGAIRGKKAPPPSPEETEPFLLSIDLALFDQLTMKP